MVRNSELMRLDRAIHNLTEASMLEKPALAGVAVGEALLAMDEILSRLKNLEGKADDGA